MPLTKQQLLIPRVLCIGGKEGETNYPGGPVKTGQILTLFSNWFYETEDQKSSVHKYAVKDFPHLFKPLPWWEMRDKSDMPEYIKWIYPGTKEISYHKVFQWLSNSAGIYVADVEIGNIFIKDIEPADESDYQEYQKQKEAK